MVMCSVCLLCTSMVSGLSSCAISAGGPSVASTSTLVLVYWGREGVGEGGRGWGREGGREGGREWVREGGSGEGREGGWRDRGKILFEMALNNCMYYCHGNLIGVGDTSTTECLP